jgi:RES domain-containing protein
MNFRGRAFRGHDPRWSFDPLSGEGASISGGRFNKKGQPTLYLALDIITAVMEITQGFSNRLSPLLLCEYDVNCRDIIDLSALESRRFHNVELGQMACPWLTLQQAGKVSPSQALAERLQKEGFVGAIVPSFAPTATAANINLVLWRWGPDLPNRIRLYDPEKRIDPPAL